MPSSTIETEADGALVALLAALRETGYRFVTVSPATHARVVARPERAQAAGLTDVFGWSLPFGPGVVPDPILDLMRRADILTREEDRMRSTIRVSSLGGDLFAHSAYPTRDPDAVFFGPDTYRFVGAIEAWLRPDRADAVRRAVDIGAGAGPGGIAIAKAAPQAEVVLVDVNDAALRLARLNARAAGATGALACRSDLLSALDGPFDLIVSNPPYLNDPLGRAYRHGGGALGEGLSVRILDASLDRLAPGGTLILYTGVAIVNGRDPFLRAAEDRLRTGAVPWSYRELDPDVFGEELETDVYRSAERIAAIVLIATAPR